MNISKSVDIYDTEQKYEHLKLHNENIRLLLKGQRNYTFILILLFYVFTHYCLFSYDKKERIVHF